MNLMELSPPEAFQTFSRVFKQLHIDDRKNVRLTCSAWNKACNSPEIIEREKFVFHVGNLGFDPQDLKALQKCLMKRENIRTYFEFHDLPAHKLPPGLWGTISSSVKFLFLNECELDNGILHAIVRRCNALNSLHVNQAAPKAPESILIRRRTNNATNRDSDSARKETDFRFFVPQKNLTSLQLFIGIDVSVETIRNLYKTFPNLRTFGTDVKLKGEDPLNEFPPKIKDLTYLVNINSLSGISNLMLREVKLDVDFTTCSEDIKQFFSTQTALENINLSFGYNERSPGIDLRKDEKWEQHNYEMKELLFLIMKNCPKLKVFELDGARFWSLRFTAPEFTTFLDEICRLEVLSLRICECSLYKPEKAKMGLIPFLRTLMNPPSKTKSEERSVQFHETKSEQRSMKFQKMLKLKLLFENCFDLQDAFEFILTILKQCCALQCLSLKPFNREIMEEIFENHVGIQKLNLEPSYFHPIGHSIFPVENEDDRSSMEQKTVLHSLNRLQNLESLSIFPLYAVDNILREFNFSNLKYYHCSVSSLANEEDAGQFLNNLSVKACNLEGLSIWSNNWKETYDETIVVDCIMNLKKLRFLELSFCRIQPQQAEKLFSACPSLRGIKGGVTMKGEKDGYMNTESNFLYNRVLQSPVQCSENYFEAREMPKFANYETFTFFAI